MIITVTPSPSLDRTYRLGRLVPGEVNRAEGDSVEASGKGVNITRALTRAGVASVAVLPLGGAEGTQLAGLLAAEGVAHAIAPCAAGTRTNTTLAMPDGLTTKVNAPAPSLTLAEQATLLAAVRRAAGTESVSWVVFSGTAPAGSESLLTEIVAVARDLGARSAVDTSGAALPIALDARPDLLAPNHLELAELLGVPAGHGDLDRGADGDAEGERASLRRWAVLAGQVAERTGGAVLASLGAAGALYVDRGCRIHAATPPVVPVNTAGAGDALLAGFLAATVRLPPLDVEACLRQAVSWGTAACGMPTTSGDIAAEADPSGVVVRSVAP